MSKPINIIFDGASGPDAPRFIEVEDDEGCSIKIGEAMDIGRCELQNCQIEKDLENHD